MNNINPFLVSVGIPTYNRPDSLKRTLEYITAQTYRNLEIIVSDNCSPAEETEKIVNEFIEKDNRIQFFRQPENKGPFFNFKFVLSKAKGDYFMWAADDDKWNSSFIEKIMLTFKTEEKNYVAVITEGQYIDNNGNNYDFFSEGKPFYNFYSEKKMSRLIHLLKFNYGNLVYGIFKTAALKKNNIIFAENEIPFLLQVMEKGNFKVLPDVGFYKNPPSYQTYLQARWEKSGGKLPNSSFTYKYYKGLKLNFFYHLAAFDNIRKAIRSLDLKNAEKNYLIFLSFFYLAKHFFYFIIRYKPKSFLT